MNKEYQHNEDDTYRYILGEYQNTNGKILMVIGVNPSTATDKKLDRTVSSVKKRAFNNNYIGYIMLNLYPQRATNPNDMDINLNLNEHNSNIEMISNIIEKFSNHQIDIWCAWGNLIYKREYLSKCLIDIYNSIKKNDNLNWIYFGNLTKFKNPRHPLYLKSNLKSQSFDIYDYIQSLKKS